MVDLGLEHHAEFFALAREALRSAASELLRSYGGEDPVLLDNREPVSLDEFVLAAAIGFAGPKLHGTLVVAVPRPLLDLLSPLAEGCVSHGDWIGELGNQLLGRIKNKWVPYGIDVRLGTPAVVEGRSLRLHSAGGPILEQHLVCSENLVCLWLAVVPSDDLRVAPTHDQTAEEGSVQLF